MSAPSAAPIILQNHTALGATSVLFYLFIGGITGTGPITYSVFWGTSPTSQINKVDALPIPPSTTQLYARIDYLEPNTTYYFKTVTTGFVSPPKESEVFSLKTAWFSGFEVLPNFFFQSGSAINVRNNRISPNTVLYFCYQGRIRDDPNPLTNFFVECRKFELGELVTTTESIGNESNGFRANRYQEIIKNINQIRKFIDTNAPGQGRANLKGGKETMFIQDISSDQVSRETICYVMKKGPENITNLYQRKSITYIDNKTDFIVTEAQDRILCIEPQTP